MAEESVTVDFTQSFDARDWARAFVEHVTAQPTIATDEGTLIAWFANALMRGWDEHARRCPTDALIRVVAQFDGTPTISREHFDACNAIFVEALQLARPHVDPDGYRLDVRQRQMDAESPHA
jgi:hypothetical protein